MTERGTQSGVGPATGGAEAWRCAMQTAMLIAVDPSGLGGACIRSAPGPVRDLWLEGLRALLPESAPFRRLPPGAPLARLVGGIDLSATLAAGRPILEHGLMSAAHGGVLVAAMAERLDGAIAACLSGALDTGEARVERDGFSRSLPAAFALILLDEGAGEDEQPPALLVERAAFLVDLDGIGVADAPPFDVDRDRVGAARLRLDAVEADDDVVAALCAAGGAVGVASIRTLMFALRAARASAALNGRKAVSSEDAALACRLVFAPRASALPQAEPEKGSAEPPPPDKQQSDVEKSAASDIDVEDLLVAATRAAIPAGLLARLAAGERARNAGKAGKSGALRASLRNGRPYGSRPGDPARHGRLKVVDTLRAAAPWQRLRGRLGPDQPIAVRRDDFRVARYRERRQSLAIFAVDASGSSAVQRLGEAKGAIEMLLAECYSRRDEVALVAFRQATADLVLPPTRSLVRARRALAELAGGGGTPLAAGIDAAGRLARQAARNGRTPTIVLITDGRANVGLDGLGGREAAQADARAAARRLKECGARLLVIDASPRPEPRAAEIAAECGGRYLPLPHADPRAVSSAVKMAQQ